VVRWSQRGDWIPISLSFVFALAAVILPFLYVGLCLPLRTGRASASTRPSRVKWRVPSLGWTVLEVYGIGLLIYVALIVLAIPAAFGPDGPFSFCVLLG